MIKNATIKILDEINVILIGLSPTEHKYLHNVYGLFLKNHRYMKSFMLKRWDGKIYFYSELGKTYIYLLPEIIKILKNWGYKLSLLDMRKQYNIPNILLTDQYFIDYNIILAPHQITAINAIISNNGKGILIAGTGAGKTIMTAALSKYYTTNTYRRCLIIVPTTDLIDQTRDEFLNVGIPAGEYSGNIKDETGQIIISTWQALQNNPRLVQLFGVVIVDECQGARGDVLKSLLNVYGKDIPIKIGVTATLPKDPLELLTINIALGDIQHTTSSHTLINNNWLAKPKIMMLGMVEDVHSYWELYKSNHITEDVNFCPLSYIRFKNQFLPDYDAERKFTKKNKNRLAFITNIINGVRSREKGNCFILVNSIEEGKKLESLIDNSRYINQSDKNEDRKKLYKLFDVENNLVVIATYKLASVGLNIPRIFTFIMIDAGRGYIKTIQSIGRSLRKAHDKDNVLIIDIYSDFKYGKKHAKDRIRYYNEHKYPYKINNVEYTGK